MSVSNKVLDVLKLKLEGDKIFIMMYGSLKLWKGLLYKMHYKTNSKKCIRINYVSANDVCINLITLHYISL